MISIRAVRLELQKKMSSLLYAEATTADKRLSDFINFIDQNTSLKSNLDTIALDTIDWVAWEKKLWNSIDYGFPEAEDKTAKMCYDVLKRYRGNDLINIALNFHCDTRKITDHIQKYFETFVPFLYEYLDKKLFESETSISPADMIDEIRKLVDESTLEMYPNINTRLKDIFQKLYISETNDDFKGIANICRSIIIDFANSVFHNSYLPSGLPILQEDNAKDKLKYTYKHFSSLKDKNYTAGKEMIILGTWKIISSCVHRKHIQKAEIKECVLFTYLLINTFINELC